jgi:uncharacterized membrane protein YoaK (UPF0700 family)
MNVPPADRLLPALLLALAAVTGCIDAVSFLALGHVFTANMTGNVVLLGVAIAGVPGLSVGRSGAALGAFLVGALIGGRLVARSDPRHRWASVGFGLEALLLLVSAGLAAGGGDDVLREPTRLYGLITLLGLAMGVRNAVVRKLHVHDISTTVLTTTITGIVADSRLAGGADPGWMRRVLSVVLIFVGAAAGACLIRHSAALAVALAGIVSGLCAVGARIAGASTPSGAPEPPSR